MAPASHGVADGERCPACGAFTGRAGLRRRRSAALRLHAKGVNVSEIAKRMGVTTVAVYNWIRFYASDGAPLARRRQGRHPVLAPSEIARVRSLMQVSPREYGIAGDRWTASALVALVEKFFSKHLSVGSAGSLKKRVMSE